jgi:DEAD/DEAH box helicase domain-containing protein
MSLEIRVTNKLPEQADAPNDSIFRHMLDIFQAYAGTLAKPYTHQAKVWESLAANQNTFIVAGTASGKTLAVAVPLFYKLFRAQESQCIRRALWMYPTIALLEDQRRVLTDLGKALGLDPEAIIGELYGGMSRSQLISALNKPVILATPDEIYWFFRKNIKYNSLLIYGLALVDEFVLDEAHLFNGLMLRNFEHLWLRIKTLAGYLGKIPSLHVLTATPAEGLQRLNAAQPITGKSKCTDVDVEIRASGRFDRAQHFINTVGEALQGGQRKILLVCNSARMAHQLFEKCKVEDPSTIPVEHRLRFGKIALGPLTQWLEKAGVEKALLTELHERLLRDEDVVLADAPDNTPISLPLEAVLLHTQEILERQCWQVKRALWQRAQYPGETWESLLNNRTLPCRIVAAVRTQLEQTATPEKQQMVIDGWLADTVERLNSITTDPILCQAKEFSALTEVFTSSGLDNEIATSLIRKMLFVMKADPRQLPTRYMSHRPIYLRWLHSLIDRDKANRVRDLVTAGMVAGELQVECRHIGLWGGTDVPVIVYSGSMAKQVREGLINVFADLEQAVLVSTSAVEVGVDFHADALITEECEGNAFLQRFGRVGRHDEGSRVVALVSGDKYAALSGFSGAQMSREDFSAKITEVFPHRNYAEGSLLLDANHYLINTQLGRIGERLNATPDLLAAKPLAEQLRPTDMQFAFGLRSTIPQITLRDGVTKDPFYLLRYVDDQDLRPADSPFEVARAKVWFTNLIFQRARFDIIVDWEETLWASQHVFVWAGNKFHIWSQPSAGILYLKQMDSHFAQAGGWNKRHPGNFMFLYGDVYLSRGDLEVHSYEPVRDSEQNPLFIPSQTYLVLWGWTDRGETEELLNQAGVANWEELYYDWDRLKPDRNGKAMVIVEKTTGACFAAYRELLNYVHRQAEK